MNIFAGLFEKLKASFSRFAAMYFFTVTGAVFVSAFVFAGYETGKILKPFIMDCGFFCVFSILFKLVSEKFWEQNLKVKILNVAVPLVLSVPFYFACKTWYENNYFDLAILCVWSVMILISGLFIYLESKEKTGASILSSFVLSNILSVSVGVALTVIIFAVDSLLFDIGREEYYICSAWIFAYWPLFAGFFVSLATLKYDQITTGQSFKVVFLYALFPLYWVLVAILYLYLLKSIFTLSLPNGQINWFVSFASAFFILFNVALRCYKNRFTDLFYKWGGLILTPLVVIQIIAFTIRVTAYGLTFARYASLLYISFSSVVIACTIYEGFSKEKRVDFVKTVLVAGSAVLIFACLPYVNLIDVSKKSMISVIENTYRKHQMFDEEKGLLLTENAENVFSAREKNSIRTAWYELPYSMNKHEIRWAAFELKENSENKVYENFSFERTFGFAYKWNYEENINGKSFSFNASHVKVDVKGFSSMCIAEKLTRNEKDGKIYVTFDSESEKWDVTEECNNFLEAYKKKESIDKPYIIDRGNRRLVLTYMYYDYEELNDGTVHFYGSVNGYLLIK